MKVLFSYEPEAPDELALEENDVISVLAEVLSLLLLLPSPCVLKTKWVVLVLVVVVVVVVVVGSATPCSFSGSQRLVARAS